MSNQDKKINFDVRKSRPQTLASVFGGFLDMIGGHASDADVAKNWNNIVGNDISKIAKVIAIKRDKNKKINIVLRPVMPAFALELSYKKDEIKSKIDKYYGSDTVGKITIRK